MTDSKSVPSKPSFWSTVRAAWRPYRRLFSYVKPYRVRFILGLAFGVAFGVVNGMLPLVLSRVTSFVFHGSATPNPRAILGHVSEFDSGPKINSIALICLAIPAVMTVRSIFSYCNAYYMAWVSNKVVTDIRNELFSKMVRQSMDFFNRMHSGFLMSRITNDTRIKVKPRACYRRICNDQRCDRVKVDGRT